MEKYLHYYTQHSQYVEPTNKPAVSYCEQEDEVHYHPDPFNGHEYVDLGLPSGTLWAKCNVGAQNETDYGLYFAWGETTGYTLEQITGSAIPHKSFEWDNDYNESTGAGYKYGKFNQNGNPNYGMTKYNTTDNLMELELIDDAAAVNMGGQWHIPSITQLNELINAQEVSHVLTTLNGVNGLKIMNTVDNSKYIFLPTAGFCNYSSNTGAGISGCIQSSSIDAWDSVDRNMSLGFISSTVVGENNYERYYGMSVRGVVTPTNEVDLNEEK